MKLDDIVKYLQFVLTNRTGITLDPGTLEQPKTGYAVSLPGMEVRTNAVPTPVLIVAWLHDVALPAIQALARRGERGFVGAWTDDKTGHRYLDVSVVTDDLTAAIDWGRAGQQLAVWNIAGNCEIRLN